MTNDRYRPDHPMMEKAQILFLPGKSAVQEHLAKVKTEGFPSGDHRKLQLHRYQRQSISQYANPTRPRVPLGFRQPKDSRKDILNSLKQRPSTSVVMKGTMDPYTVDKGNVGKKRRPNTVDVLDTTRSIASSTHSMPVQAGMKISKEKQELRDAAGIPNTKVFPHCLCPAWKARAPVRPAFFTYDPITQTRDRYEVDTKHPVGGENFPMRKYRTDRTQVELEVGRFESVGVPTERDPSFVQPEAQQLAFNRRKGVVEFTDFARSTCPRWNPESLGQISDNPQVFFRTSGESGSSLCRDDGYFRSILQDCVRRCPMWGEKPSSSWSLVRTLESIENIESMLLGEEHAGKVTLVQKDFSCGAQHSFIVDLDR